jgi:hypothetical protein
MYCEIHVYFTVIKYQIFYLYSVVYSFSIADIFIFNINNSKQRNYITYMTLRDF